MSGIAGIVNLDGAPVDAEALRRMVEFLAYRGPDARNLQSDGQAGLVHAALWTTPEAERERQPMSLDGQVWITADARIDGWDQLIRELDASGQSVPKDVTDTALILMAYRAWGENCVDHLLGDFAFAIWDGPERRLFCARDHMGAKPFFYAQAGNKFLFSNTLDCLRLNPDVPDDLNEGTIADFLLYGFNQNIAATAFAGIQRLPAAHAATWTEKGLRLRQYWELPIDEPLLYPREDDYTERFRELLRIAVGDRLRSSRLGILQSGGLDSATMTATACDWRCARPGAFTLEAFTYVYDHLMPDRERHYAGLVARHLDVPIVFFPRDGEAFVPPAEQPLVQTPEPIWDPFSFSLTVGTHKTLASRARVFLNGEGPDNALGCDWRVHLKHLVRQRRWGRLFPDFWFHLVGHPRIPYVNRIRQRMRGYRPTDFPSWINPDFARRFQMRERWGKYTYTANSHPTRPASYSGLSPQLWQRFLEQCDLIGSLTQSEFRYPYVDIRLLRFFLAIPAIPWCCNKTLLRRALRGRVPEQVIRRRKSPLARHPDYERALRVGLPEFPVTDDFRRFVIPDTITRHVGKNIGQFEADMRAISLAHWVDNLPKNP